MLRMSAGEPCAARGMLDEAVRAAAGYGTDMAAAVAGAVVSAVLLADAAAVFTDGLAAGWNLALQEGARAQMELAPGRWQVAATQEDELLAALGVLGGAEEARKAEEANGGGEGLGSR